MSIPSETQRVVKVNAIEFESICGHDSSYLHYCGNLHFDVGDQVCIRHCSVGMELFSGMQVSRYVTEVSNRYALQSDDYACLLRLSPFNPLTV
jgi:hypothetical protein